MKKFMKITIGMLLTVFMVSNIYIGVDAYATTGYGLPSKHEFLNMVKNDAHYIQYKDKLITAVPKVVNYLRDENNTPYGYIAQFEFEYGYKVNETIQLASLLTFIYDEKKKEIETVVIDYSKAYSDGKIYIRDNIGNVLYSYVLNENDTLKKYLSTLTEEVEELKTMKETTGYESTLANRICWTCTKYENRGDDYDSKCSLLIGTACSFGDKVPIYGRILCAGALIVGCYIPPYKVCVDGYWGDICPETEL
ncbi:hypothetical protein [Paenibacillus dendritiformis]|uniref:Uncharacterized protein n=1 Tax=Paenibacillus dendritiformis C454 TaxID=1131935 RepID=H3SGN1_9BACL|nr:hypothetical protein [Paenibacillus dendritiformis]EHQ61766.1 hypothetical protein PDENDC454_13430 [Paenibacillus dendritiformis C454]CAH8768981.1 hypothetical protein H7S4_001679 [Paenibacillus dendritiformis]